MKTRATTLLGTLTIEWRPPLCASTEKAKEDIAGRWLHAASREAKPAPATRHDCCVYRCRIEANAHGD